MANHYHDQPSAPDGWHIIEHGIGHGYPPEYGFESALESAPAPSRRQRVGNITGWVFAVVAVAVLIVAVVWMGVTTSKYSTATVEDQRAREAVRTPLEQPVAPGDPAAGDVQVAANRILVPEYALWAPGTLIQTTDHYPEPGESFTAQSCTVAFSFSDVQGRNYAVTAGHCGREGDLVWPTNASHATDYVHEAGRFLYSGLYTAGADGVDVGIIEITDPDRYMNVVGDPIPTGIGLELPDAIQRVCKTGGTTGYTCGPFVDTQRVQIVNTEIDDGRPTYGDIAAVCASFGDSGGPVFTEVNGRAVVVGVVSGTEAGRDGEECWEGMEDPKLMSYSNLAQTLGVIERVVPEPAWVTQTW